MAYGNYAENFDLPPLKPRDIRIPGAGAIPLVEMLNLDEIATAANDGTISVLLIAQWKAKPYYTEFQVRRKGDIITQNIPPVIGSRASLVAVIPGVTYEVRARHISANNGDTGEWSEWVPRLIGGDLDPPGRVAGLTHLSTPGGGQLDWLLPPEKDYDLTEIFINEVERNFKTATLTAAIKGTTYTHAGYDTQLLSLIHI